MYARSPVRTCLKLHTETFAIYSLLGHLLLWPNSVIDSVTIFEIFFCSMWEIIWRRVMIFVTFNWSKGKHSWLVIERNHWNKGKEPQQSNEDFFCFIHRRRFIMTFLGASYCGNRRLFLSATGPTGITWPFSYLLRARGQRYRNTWKRMRTISLIMTKKMWM